MDVFDNEMDFEYIVVVGASTGGKEAIYKMLKKLPNNFPPILFVQQSSPEYISSTVRYLNKMTNFDVIEAVGGEKPKPGMVLIASGYYQMRLVTKDTGIFVSCIEEGAYNGNCPSIDVLFNSVSEIIKDKTIGIVLTGANDDGAAGLLKIRESGGYTICQDKESSVSFEKPLAAIKMGGAEFQLDLNSIPNKLLDIVSKNKKTIFLENYENSCKKVVNL